MKKRLVLSLFSILLVSLLFSPHTFSQETSGTVVRVAPRPLLSDNDSYRVDIVIQNGQAVTGYQVMLQYDSDYIEYVAIDHGNYLPDDAFFGDAQARDTDPNDSLKAILFAATAFPNQSEGDGVLATLTFETKTAKSSDLTLLDVTLLSHDVVDNTPALSSPQLENSRTHVVKSPDIEKVVQATYSYKGVFLFRDDPEPITTLEEIIRRDEWGNEHYDLDGDEDITATDLAWMTLAVRLDVNDDKKINTQDRNAVEKVFDKKGSRPEDVNGDRKVNIQDIILVNTAILTVENLSRQLSNLPVKEVVQATYSHEGVFLFRDDPEPIATLEEIIRRDEWGNERYDLDGDEDITATDLAWMTLAVRLDVNDDGKINMQDREAVGNAYYKEGSRPEDVNDDKIVDLQDIILVENAILTFGNLSRQLSNLPVKEVVQATYSHEGVFLFRDDPELIATLKEMFKRGESGPRYDLDEDKKITQTDLTWMHLAMKLDVNDDGKINTQDREAVKKADDKEGIRPEDINDDKIVNYDDVYLVDEAIWAVESLLQQWKNLPVEKVVQATYSHAGVFLFPKDPDLRNDLNGDGDITRTDLLWMRFAMKLDVNNDGKIDWQDEEAVNAALFKTASQPEDVNGDGEVNYQDMKLVERAISEVYRLARPIVQVIWYHPYDVAAYKNGDGWDVNIDSMSQILRKVENFYNDQLGRPSPLHSTYFINPRVHVIVSRYDHAKLVSDATYSHLSPYDVFSNDLKQKWQTRKNTEPSWRSLGQTDMSKTQDIYLVVVQSDAKIIDSPGVRGKAFPMFGSDTYRFQHGKYREFRDRH